MLEINDCSSIRISLASPDAIRGWSKGEVTKPETINKRTLKPERDGLFCEKIFGPIHDWECYCGKYKRVRYRGVVCDKCGVEVTRSKVRRERMGHIQLATPVSHIWFVKGSPSRLSLLLDITPRNLERVLYFAAHIVTEIDEVARAEAREDLEFYYDEKIAVLERDADHKKGQISANLPRNHTNVDSAYTKNTTIINRKLADIDALRRILKSEYEALREQLENREGEKVEEDLLFRSYVLVEEGRAIREETIDMLDELYEHEMALLDTQIQQVSDIYAQHRTLKSEYEALREQLKNRVYEIVEEDLLFSSHVLVEEGRAIREETIDMLDELYEREIALLDTQSQQVSDNELLRSASREQLEQTARAKQNRISEKRDRDIDLLLKEKQRKLDALDSIRMKRILSETDYHDLQGIAFSVFKAEMGASAIRSLIERTVDLDTLAATLQDEINNTSNSPKRKMLTKRLRVVEAFRKSGNKPEWMLMTVLPIIPPDLRPMVQLDGGRFATSDLNDLYRRVINRNNRLKRLMDLKAPDIIVRNEKRMLQEAVDDLIDNGRRGRAISGNGKLRLKSLSDMLKGKHGRFRQNLLGKRVDYSGRSVIVVGHSLKLHQCGLPKKMALELFKPFVMQRLVQNKIVSNIKGAKKYVERIKPEVWDVLEEVIREYHVLLNRAPSLHRLSMQAFEAQLIEGSAIQLHPLVCTAFNADFDGDQMAVHVPISRKAQEEARLRMLSTYNLFSPANGEPSITPTQDIVLGCFYLTLINNTALGAGKTFANADEALLAYERGYIHLHAPIFVRMQGTKLYGENIKATKDGKKIPAEVRELPSGPNGESRMLLETSVGRLIFNQELLPPLQYRNHEITKDSLKHIVTECYKHYTNIDNVSYQDLHAIRDKYPHRTFSIEELTRYYGSERTAEQADKIKTLGFHYATLGGLTVSISDVAVPSTKSEIIRNTELEQTTTQRRFDRGLMTENERYNKVINIWRDAGEKMTKHVRAVHDVHAERTDVAPNQITRFNPVSMMFASNARGHIHHLVQLAGMRGLMVNPSGKIIELPVRSNLREGLSVHDYFISTHGARKGQADTALRTADAGYLTSRLINVAHDQIITMEDCGSAESLLLHSNDDDEVMKPLHQRVVGRVTAEPIYARDGSLLLDANEEIHEDIASKLPTNNIRYVRVRTPLYCQAEYGICRKCYGRDLATGMMVAISEAVGIIAAQSIGEPGTQLTLRTFTSGGTIMSSDITQGIPRIIEIFEARVNIETKAILAELDGVLIQDKTDNKHILTIKDETIVSHKQIMPNHYVPDIQHGTQVYKNKIIARSVRNNLYDQPMRAYQDGIALISGNVINIGTRHTEEIERIVPNTARLSKGLHEGARVYVGQFLTEGAAHPQELLELQGRDVLQNYLLKEAQKVYRSHGVDINDKHIEVIIRQMLRRVRITDPGDTHYLHNETVDQFELMRVNAEIWAQGGMPATATSRLLGITRASFMTDSFLSAASFQETTRVLTEAATTGKIDYLRGLKENVVIGKLIPAGTGAEERRRITIQNETAAIQATIIATNDVFQTQAVASTSTLRTQNLSPEDLAALKLAESLRQDLDDVYDEE